MKHAEIVAGQARAAIYSGVFGGLALWGEEGGEEALFG